MGVRRDYCRLVNRVPLVMLLYCWCCCVLCVGVLLNICFNVLLMPCLRDKGALTYVADCCGRFSGFLLFVFFLAQVKEELISRTRAAAASRTANGTSDDEDDAQGMPRYTRYLLCGMVWYCMVWYYFGWYGMV